VSQISFRGLGSVLGIDNVVAKKNYAMKTGGIASPILTSALDEDE
jgi:hypothetical protein